MVPTGVRVRRLGLWVGLCCLVATLMPTSAHSDEKEWSIAVTPSYAVAYADGRTGHGGGFALDLGYGVSDSLSLHVLGVMSWHALDSSRVAPSGVVGGWAAMAGLTYTLDVIRLVPSFTVALGALGVYPGADYAGSPSVLKPITGFGVGLGFALDYLISRHVAVGVEVRYQTALTDLDRLPMYLYCGPRVLFRFGG